MKKTNIYLYSMLFLGMIVMVGCSQQPSIDNKTDVNTSNGSRQYISTNLTQCAATDWICDPGMQQFYDETGCGCEPIKNSSTSDGKLKATDCTDPRPEACTREYDPVCGWFDPAEVQCIKYPCAQTFGNKCEACADNKVISWTEGECPE